MEATREHIDSIHCWCGPERLQYCGDCDGNSPGCVRCQGKDLIPEYDYGAPVVLLHHGEHHPVDEPYTGVFCKLKGWARLSNADVIACTLCWIISAAIGIISASLKMQPHERDSGRPTARNVYTTRR